MKPALPSQMARGVEVRTKYAVRHACVTQSEIRSSPVYAGHAIKPLKKLAFAHKISAWAPAVLDRIEAIRLSRRPLPTSLQGDGFPFLSSNPCGCPERNGLLSNWIFGMRAQTCQQPPACPEPGYLTSLYPLAKSKIRAADTLEQTKAANFLVRFCHIGGPSLV
jgi:hypothetical protein